MAVQDVSSPIVHKVSMNPGNETRKAKTRLDEIFEEKEERAARRFSAAELDKMALEAENEAARLRGEPPKYKYHSGGEEMDEEGKKKAEEQRQKMIDSARALIDSGLEPKQVGQMLMGLAPTAGTPPVVSQGMGLDDVIKVVNLVTEKKETSEFRSAIKDLEKKIEDLGKGGVGGKVDVKQQDPIAFAKQQADAIVAWNKVIKELTPSPPPANDRGEPMDVVRERNRHDEKMEEIKVDREHKQNLANIAGDAAERVGYGLGNQIRESGGGGNNSVGLETIKCKDCGNSIFITPETGNSVTCPKCGAVYERGAAVEAQEG